MIMLCAEQRLIKSSGEMYELRLELVRGYNQEPNMMPRA